jgi:hypothetical protein
VTSPLTSPSLAPILNHSAVAEDSHLSWSLPCRVIQSIRDITCFISNTYAGDGSHLPAKGGRKGQVSLQSPFHLPTTMGHLGNCFPTERPSALPVMWKNASTPLL